MLLYCSSHTVGEFCYGKCKCRGNIIICESVNSTETPSELSEWRELRAIIMINNSLTLSNTSFYGLHFLGKLILRRNKIQSLPPEVFFDLENLFQLDLSYNLLISVSVGLFTRLKSLQMLDLSYNAIGGLPKATFEGLISLQHLNLKNNQLNKLHDETFDSRALPLLEQLHTDAYKFCCIAKHVRKCTPEPDEFSSCQDLLSNRSLQISIWVLGVIALFGNLFVVIWRSIKEKFKVASFFIWNLALSDSLMGVYLLIIATVDTFYRGRYIMFADEWRSSAICNTAGFLAMLSSEVSVYMMTAMTVDRFISIVCIFKVDSLRMRQARFICIGGWTGCFIFCVLPALGIPYFGDQFFGRTGSNFTYFTDI